jgi:hypothetical protein
MIDPSLAKRQTAFKNSVLHKGTNFKGLPSGLMPALRIWSVGGSMFQRLDAPSGNLVHLDRIEAAVRTRFALPAQEIVLVTEEPGTVPGHPPRLVTIRFWKDGVRHRLRIFKRAGDVAEEDLPVAWLQRALIDDGDPDCC